MSGDRCERQGCDGFLKVYRTTATAEHRIRYLRCAICRVAPEKNKLVIPLSHSRRRADYR